MRKLLPLVFMLLFSATHAAANEAAAALDDARSVDSPRLHGAMGALSEDEMSGVAGAQGVVLELKLYNNVDKTTLAPLSCAAVVGTPNACRMGLEFAARTGIWLMMKEYFGSLHVKDIRMDAGFAPATNTAYYDPARFKDVSGADLIPGANPINLPGILMRYPATDAQGTYDDLHAYLNVGRTWLEYDQGATAGYDRDTTLDSVFSIRLAEPVGNGWIPDPDNPPDVKLSNNAPAKMRFWGTAYVFGF